MHEIPMDKHIGKGCKEVSVRGLETVANTGDLRQQCFILCSEVFPGVVRFLLRSDNPVATQLFQKSLIFSNLQKHMIRLCYMEVDVQLFLIMKKLVESAWQAPLEVILIMKSW